MLYTFIKIMYILMLELSILTIILQGLWFTEHNQVHIGHRYFLRHWVF